MLQAALLHGATKAGSMISGDNPKALALIRETPPGAEDVAVAFIEGMLSRAAVTVPGLPLVDACVTLYTRCKDVRVIALALPGMPRAQALEYLGHLVRLPAGAFKSAVRQLVAVHDAQEPLLKPIELINHLHIVDVADVRLPFSAIVALAAAGVRVPRPVDSLSTGF